jgi:hypothetical protein
MKKLMAKIALNIALKAFDLFYNWVDANDDGKISKEELFAKAEIIDKKSRAIVKKLKR